MKVEIKNEYPPNWDLIKMHLNPPEHSVITVDGVIYNPSKNPIYPDILEHEKVHILQQKNDPSYLSKYLTDPKYREEMEIEAYHRQYQYLKEEVKVSTKDLKHFLYEMAQALSRDYKLDLDYGKAESLIRNYGKYI